MSRPTANAVLDSMNLRPTLLAQRHASNGLTLEATSSPLLSDMRALATADPLREEQIAATQRRHIAAAYGVTNYAPADDKPFIFFNGYALIPIHGVLINRFAYSWSFVTGYNFIRAQVEAASEDDDVVGIIYDVNSPGGMVAGCRETSDIIRAASSKGGGKPSIAVVDANCYSAAYMLACAADKIAVTPTGGVGSIGVLMMHMDLSKMLDDIGIKVTFIFSGSHKVDGNPFEPLPASVRDRLQVESDKIYDDFVQTVVTNRSLSPEVVRGTEAQTFFPEEGLSLGLIDSVETPPAALETFFNASEGDENNPSAPGEHDPTDELGNEEDPDDPDDNDRRQQVTTAQQTQPAPNATATGPTAAEAAQAARVAERARVSGIMGHAEAQGRTELANHLAMNTDMDIEAAAAVMKASPKAAPPKEVTSTAVTTQEANPFAAAMDNGKHPNVGGEGAAGGGTDEKPTRAQEILANQRAARGVKTVDAKATKAA